MNAHETVALRYLRIARQIPIGTRNIDRMREDVHCTVSSVLGLSALYFFDPTQNVNRFSNEVDGYVWHIYSSNCTVEVQCLHILPNRRVIVYSNEIGKAIRIENAKGVYQALGEFILSMHLLFPKLLDGLKPLIEAAGINHELFD